MPRHVRFCFSRWLVFTLAVAGGTGILPVFAVLSHVQAATGGTPVPPAEIRTWTSADGHFTVEAELVEVVKGTVKLRKANGTILNVPLEKISKADREYALSAKKTAQSKPAPPKPDTLIVPGVCSIESPGEGFQWKKMFTLDHERTSVEVFTCTRPGVESLITLTILDDVVGIDSNRISWARDFFDGQVSAIKRLGRTEIQGEPPAAESLVAGRVAFSISSGKPGENAWQTRVVVVFGSKKTYTCSVSARSPAEADRLLAVAKTLQELGPEKDK
jgi:hypothetical protein